MADYDFVAKRALEKAKSYANYHKEKDIRVCHLIYSILTDKFENFATKILLEMNVDIDLLKKSIEKIRVGNIKSDGKKQKTIKISPTLKKILEHAYLHQLPFNDDKKATVADIFIACIAVKNETSQLFVDFGIDINTFTDVAYDVDVEMADFEIIDYEDIQNINTKAVTNYKSNSNIDTIQQFCTNLTNIVSEYEISPCFGRDQEMQQLYRVLLRRKKRNPMLIGKAGVGKTNLVEGLAYNIIKGTVPEKLMNKQVFSLNLNSLVSGTKYRGMFEDRVEKLLTELTRNDNIILFIDEIHTIIGTGNAEGSSDMSNILKPYLSRNGLQLIGATTTNEYKKYLEKDKALKRRFGEIQVDEPSVNTSIEILQNIKVVYENTHNVSYTDEAIESCVELSDKYITYRTLPDKAIDVMDDVAVKKRLSEEDNTKLTELQKKYKSIESVKMDIIANKDYDRAEEVKKTSNRLMLELKRERSKTKKQKSKRIEINSADVREIIEEITKIPISDKGIDIKNLKTNLKSTIIGQDNAIDSIVKTLLINKLNLDDGDKPIGSFMFVGYSGVGKTKITRELTNNLFGNDKFLIRIDCSEYTQPHEISKLIGAPAGYVGYSEGGILTEAVKRNPFSIILFDEIEKAHDKLFDILLQVLGEGRLTDNMGEIINFKNTLVILTSNVGTKKSISNQSRIGYSKQSFDYDESIIDMEINKRFRPEFINRIDNVIHFNTLEKDALMQILDIELDKLIKQVAKHGVKLKISASVKTFIVDNSYIPEKGFRPLKRKINDDIKLLVAEKLLESDGTEIKLALRKDKIVLI